MDDSIAGRALRGGVALGVRQVLVHGTNLLGIVVLARTLDAASFGAVTISLFLLQVVTGACALGLGASLVREAAEPSTSELHTVLAAQHAVGAALAVLLWIVAPWIVSLYALQPEDAWLFRAVGVVALLLPLVTLPIVRLERALDFARVAVIESAQALLFNALLLTLLWRGMGTRAVAICMVVRAAFAAALAYGVTPWRFGYALALPRLVELARFGIPFQALTWLAQLKDSLTPIVLGLSAGAAAVGYVDWAQTVATYPTLALMILQRIYVPAFARVQHEPGELSRLVERAMQATNAIAAPVAVLTLVLIGPIIDLAFGARWRAAQELFYWLWCANLVVPTVTPLVGLLNALGRSRAVLGLAVLWMLATWVLGLPLVLLLGPVGYGIANLLVQSTSFWAVRLARQDVRFRILPVVVPSWACAAAVGAVTWIVAHLWPPAAPWQLLLLTLLALAAYAGALAALQPADARRAWAMLRGRA